MWTRAPCSATSSERWVWRRQLGRLIPAGDTGPGATPVAVLGHGFWLRAYGADPGVLGRSLVLDDRPYTIVGVLPAGVGYPRPDVEVYVPMGVLAADLPWDVRDSSFGTTALARLAPGASIEAAQRDMNRVTDEVDALEGEPVVTAEVRPVEGPPPRRCGARALAPDGCGRLPPSGGRCERREPGLGPGRGAGYRAGGAPGAGCGLGRPGRASCWRRAPGCPWWEEEPGWRSPVGASDVLPRMLPLRIPSIMAAGIGVHGPVLAFALALTVLSGALFALLPGAAGFTVRGRSAPRASHHRRAGGAAHAGRAGGRPGRALPGAPGRLGTPPAQPAQHGVGGQGVRRRGRGGRAARPAAGNVRVHGGVAGLLRRARRAGSTRRRRSRARRSPSWCRCPTARGSEGSSPRTRPSTRTPRRRSSSTSYRPTTST